MAIRSVLYLDWLPLITVETNEKPKRHFSSTAEAASFTAYLLFTASITMSTTSTHNIFSFYFTPSIKKNWEFDGRFECKSGHGKYAHVKERINKNTSQGRAVGSRASNSRYVLLSHTRGAG